MVISVSAMAAILMGGQCGDKLSYQSVSIKDTIILGHSWTPGQANFVFHDCAFN